MAQGLMGLQDLLGQSSNAQQQSGLLGGGVFSQPESRGRRRSRLLNEAIAGAGQNPYARLGASFGGLIGMGGRAATEGLGIVDKPAEVQQSEAIRQVQKEVADRGLDPMSNPREFGDFVAGRFQELGQPQLATRSLLQARQIESQFAPEQPELPAAAQNLAFRAQQAGLEPGTPEYREFMRTGGDVETGQGEFKTYYGPGGEAVQARVEGNELRTLSGENITGQGYSTSSRTPQVSIDQRERPELSGPQVSTVENAAEAGNQARNIEFTLGAIEDLAVQEDIPQDALQPLITGAQGYAEALGLDFERALSSLGYEGIGDLSGKQELNRLYTDLVIRGFDKFKGNLNDREVRLAQNAQPGIGKSRDANLKAIATQRAAAEIAKRDSRMFLSATTPDEFSNALEKRDERSLDEFRELRDTYYEQLKSKSGGAQGQEGGSQEGQNERLRYNPETGRLE